VANNRRVLELQAAKIETVLARHNVAVTVRSGVLTPRTVRFELQPRSQQRVSTVQAVAGEIAQELGTRDAQVIREGDVVQLEVPRSGEAEVRLLSLSARVGRTPEASALLGSDDKGAPLLLRLPSTEVTNVLVMGDKGSGKSTLLRAMGLSLAMFNRTSELHMVLIDPRGQSLAPLAPLPHVLGDVATGEAAMTDCLRWLAGELERREGNAVSSPYLAVLIDGLDGLVALCGKQAAGIVARIAHRGREVGMHILASTSQRSSEQTPGGLEATFPVRAVAYDPGAGQESESTWVSPHDAAGRQTRGDFLLVTRGETIRFHSAWAGRSDIQTVTSLLTNPSGDEIDWLAHAAPERVPFTLHTHAMAQGDSTYTLTSERPRSILAALRRSFGRRHVPKKV